MTHARWREIRSRDIDRSRLPVLVGLHNPQSDYPQFALYPLPGGCTGNHIWKMLNSRTGATQEDYCRWFDRRNLVDSKTWDEEAAYAAAPALWEKLRGRTVVVLGQVARTVLQLPPVEPIYWRVDAGVRWCHLPHPSGRCMWYNDEFNRECAAILLEELTDGME
jgi:hypothetical protein